MLTLLKKNYQVTLLTLIPILLFHHHIFGDYTWIGNPDRLNNYLKILQSYVAGQAQGHINAWNDRELLGYNTFAIPYIYPNPLTYLIGLLSQWFGPQKLFIIAGYVSITLLIFAGLAAFAFIRAIIHDRGIAFVGASCYQLTALPILNMSQNDSTFAVFIMAPLIALAVKKANAKNLAWYFGILTIFIYMMLNFMFLQIASYVLLFSACYALYRSIQTKDKWIFIIFVLAASIAIIAAFPRMYHLFETIKTYTREFAPKYSIDLTQFNVFYELQRVSFIEIFRWFDNAILGRYPSESIVMNHLLNISEGFLLNSATLIPFIIIFSTLYHRKRWFQLPRETQYDARFFFWFLIFTFALIFLKPVSHAFYLLYLKLGFFHARILNISTLLVTTLLSIALLDLKNNIDINKIQRKWLYIIFSIISACLAIFIIEQISTLYTDPTDFILIGTFNLRDESIIRITLSFAFIAVLWYVIIRTKIKPIHQYFALVTLCSAIVFQAFINQYTQINQAHNFIMNSNFSFGDYYYANRDEFILPSKKLKEKLKTLLDNDNYRTIFICTSPGIERLCAGHMAEFWDLRSADGYYGVGVPKRLMLLPWNDRNSMRHVSFFNTDNLPWPLLSLLNVKYALSVTHPLYKNTIKEDELDAKNIEIIENPLTPLPRAYFVESIQPAANAREALEAIFKNDRLQNVQKISAVEGITAPQHFSAQGHATVTGKGDKLEVNISPSPHERFLVLNELYAPGWSAEAEGKTLTIYPTNVYARGVIVPPNVDKVVFRYE